MQRPSDADAFLLGYLPHLVQAHFDSLEAVLVAKSEGLPALAQAVAAELATLPDRGPEIVSCVWQIERLLFQGLGVVPPSPPTTRDECVSWCKTVDTAAAQLGDARVSGERAGIAEALLATGARFHRLAAHAPENERLAKYIRITRALTATRKDPPASDQPTIRAELATLKQLLAQAAPVLDLPPTAETAAALAALHGRIAICSRALESAWRGTPRSSVALWNEKQMTGNDLLRRFAEHRHWSVPCRVADGKVAPRIFEFDKRVLFAFSDDEKLAHAPSFLRKGELEVVTVPGTALFSWLTDAVDLLVLDAGEDPASKLVVNYPRELHASLRQKGEEVSASLAACDWTHVDRDVVRAHSYWILTDGARVKQLVADGGGGKSHLAVFTSEAALEAHIEKHATAEQKASFATCQRMLLKGEALFAQLATADVGVMFDPSGPGRTRAFNHKMVELLGRSRVA
ncbi:MAG TPA: hypothetical protein VIF62_34800 [Labilithrix sp.]